ncbi:glycosyltransferase family 2 protein [Dorea sp. D27]|uniref:glycosyltransferase family 2 protein n=1 Tax=Dorea sp. D27 TaxID=658665 RepID=UPI00067329D3|nr:glycosyltransferase [Dorea sp. D27]KMZ53292.1 glycosyl transferase, family 2 [Dorea sp. D27]
MAAVSIIVPVYNVEKYLNKCVDSILGQTFEAFELILVNDGSTDGSPAICRDYAGKDERVHYITQENMGPGRARNVGIAAAVGKYILFVDSDDHIAVNMVEILYRNITASDADMATCGLYNVYQNRCIPQYEGTEQFVCDTAEAFGLLLIGEKIPGSSCNKLIKAEILKDIGYPEGIVYEDVGFHTELMQKVRSVHVDTTPLYYYVHRENSITTRKFDSDAMMFIYAYEDTLRVVEQKYPRILTEARFKLIWAYFAILDRMLQEDRYWKIREYRQVRQYLKRNTIRIMRNPYFHKARKIGAIALLMNVRLYRTLTRINEKRSKELFS